MQQDDTLALPRSNPLFQPGCDVCGYRIEHLISESSRSTVFLAVNDQEPFAVKVYHLPDCGPGQEASALTQLSSDALLHVVLFGEVDAHRIEVSKFIDGKRLDGCIDPDPEMLVRDIYSGIRHLHTHGLRHNDIQPENILQSGGGYRLIDFGSLSRLDSSYTGARLQRSAFRAPETYGCSTGSTASDFWALGQTVSDMIRKSGKYQPGAFEPDRFQQLIDGLTCRNPEERWSHPQLRAWLEHRVIPARLGPIRWPEYVCIGRARASNPKELALAISAQWQAAVDLLQSGALARELTARSLTRERAVLEKHPVPDVALFCLIHTLGFGTVYRGRTLRTTADLRDVLEDSFRNGDSRACSELFRRRELTDLIRDKGLARNVQSAVQQNNGLVRAYYLLGGTQMFVNGCSFNSLDELLDFAQNSSHRLEVYESIWHSGMLPGFAAALGYKKQANAGGKLETVNIPAPLPMEAMKVLLLIESCGLAERSRQHAAEVLYRLVPPGLASRLEQYRAIDFQGEEFLRSGRKTLQVLGSIAAETGVSDRMNAASRAQDLCRLLDRIDQTSASGMVGHIYPASRCAAVAEQLKAGIAMHIARIAGNGSLGVFQSGTGSISTLPADPESLLPILLLLKKLPQQNVPQVTNITSDNALRVFGETVITSLPVAGTGQVPDNLGALFPGRLYCIPVSEYERWMAEDAEIRERKRARTQARARAWGNGFRTAGWVVAGITLGAVGLVVVVLMLALSAF